MQKFIVLVECAIEHDGRFLLIKRPEGSSTAGYWAYPGGKVEIADGGDQKDVLVQAIEREVFEEVGLRLIDPIHYVTSACFPSKNGHVVDAVFYCHIQKTALNIKLAMDEADEYVWLTVDEIRSHPHTPPWLPHYHSCIDRWKTDSL
jgi:8-oxo-dGTP diphosphatase